MVSGGSLEGRSFTSALTLGDDEWLTKVEVYYDLAVQFIHRMEFRTNLDNYVVWGYVPPAGNGRSKAERPDCRVSHFTGQRGGYFDYINVIWSC